jgi:hypothetical protein
VTDHPIRKYCDHCRDDNIGGKKSSAQYYQENAARVRAERRRRYRKQRKRK